MRAENRSLDSGEGDPPLLQGRRPPYISSSTRWLSMLYYDRPNLLIIELRMVQMLGLAALHLRSSGYWEMRCDGQYIREQGQTSQQPDEVNQNIMMGLLGRKF